MKVKVLGMDDRGKVKLSMRVVDQKTGADISDEIAKADAERRAQRNTERAESVRVWGWRHMPRHPLSFASDRLARCQYALFPCHG